MNMSSRVVCWMKAQYAAAGTFVPRFDTEASEALR